MRGIVISPQVEVAGTRLSFGGGFDLQLLRLHLLYWDKLELPRQRLIEFSTDPEIDFLIEAGVVQRTMVDIPLNGDAAQLYLTCHLEALRRLESAEPGRWSLATGSKAFSFPQEETDAGRGLLVELYQAIPVPDVDVPLADILEFKRKRSDDLQSLRFHLENLYQRILAAPDTPLAKASELEGLVAAIRDNIRVIKEARMPFRLSDVSADLNLAAPLSGAAAAWALDQPIIPGIVTGAVGALAINRGLAWKARKSSGNPYRYVASIHRDLFAGY
ncbi:DUF6236 family protein [Gellertiella hungarica]|uniref:Uncharacterized protein n=1 Tax=Gellertiella hungarica TaxID=1572859 RepID=A0A7W6NMV6_9HYPH|nr:DUF6236 family protein [Gellertiella hungarica]MBB4067418.1 hypothetical protein [Gellertiella hungarica]